MLRWTKPDAFELVAEHYAKQGEEVKAELVRAAVLRPAYMATVLLVQKRPETLALLRTWRDLLTSRGYHLADDSPSTLEMLTVASAF